jgi:hypothetical protein
VEVKYDTMRAGWCSKEVGDPMGWECGNGFGGGGIILSSMCCLR